MLPLPRMFIYGNEAQQRSKLRYDFDSGTNQGEWVPNIGAGTYYTLPANQYGYTRGIVNGQLSFTNNFTVGLSDYVIECTFYVGSNVSGYSTLCAFGNTGTRFGDNGFGDRLQFASTYGSVNTVYSLNYTKSTTYQTFRTIRIERISNVLRVYLDGIQQNFAIGTGASYINTEIVDNYAIPQDNIIYCGVSNFPVVKVRFDFK